jgi:ubiquinone/menaquinone biosynthesis C-methylase UbiE
LLDVSGIGSTPTREHRLREQYRNADVLNDRLQLYQRFATENWHQWVFRHLQRHLNGQILEVGCGTGALWLENHQWIPADWRVALSDFSLGMVEHARRQLAPVGFPFRFAVCDVRRLPFPSHLFDAVIANHMLYHVKPDRPVAFAEIRRVLKPDGVLYATTNGQNHLRDLRKLLQAFRQDGDPLAEDDASQPIGPDRFRLENGKEQLAPWFTNITVIRYTAPLIVTEAEPIVAHLRAKRRLTAESTPAFTEFVQAKIREEGAIRITPNAGLFVAF